MKQLPVNINSNKTHTSNIGDEIPLNSFLEYCENDGFIDYDGYVSSVILKGHIISDKVFQPSDLDFGIRKQLLDIQKAHGDVTIVWNNK